ncbi:Multidrug resistance-associated protein 4, partial [Nowakowskiella sp. JEL0078]
MFKSAFGHFAKPIEDPDSITPVRQRKSYNFFAQYSLFYVNELFKRGSRRALIPNDFPLVEDDDEASRLAKEIFSSWENEQKINGDKAQLWKGLLKKFRSHILLAVMLGFFLTFFQTPDAPMSQGLIYAGILSVLVLFHVFVHHVEYWQTYRLGMQLRIGFVTSIYQKCLKLSASHTSSTGFIINLVSNDVQIIEDSPRYLHYLWLGPLEC